MDDQRLWLVVLLAVFGSGGGAWLAVRVAIQVHVKYLHEGVNDAKGMAREAHHHADKAHGRITDLILKKG